MNGGDAVHQVQVSYTNNMQLEALILAGGKGTRLGGVVIDRPKPMASVNGRPFLEWLLLSLRAQGVYRVILCTGYMSEMLEAHFGDGHSLDMAVQYSRDPALLGTAGAVRHALGLVQGDRFLVLNGDSYCRADLCQLSQAHASRPASATIWLVQVDDCRRYGSVVIGKDAAVQAFQEKLPEKCAGLINAGVYLLERQVAETIPDKRAVSLETEFLPELIGHGLFAVVGEGPFLDIGTPETYAIADEFFAREKLK